MTRCKVITHMYVSIDGKIDGSYMDESGCDISGNFYDEKLWQLGNANGNGRATCQMYMAHEKINYDIYDVTNIDYNDHIIKDDYYWVVFDHTGKCDWDKNHVNYGGKKARVIMVLTTQVPKKYLAHLKNIGISYIICGGNDLDLDIALSKLKKEFNIDTLVLTGGAIINGAFHKQGLIDEISMVMAPYLEGNHNEKGYAELDSFVNHKYIFEHMTPLKDGGIHLMFKKSDE